MASIKSVAEIKAAVYQARPAAANQAIAQTDAEEQSFTQAFTEHVQEFDDAITAYGGSTPAGDVVMIDELETAFDSYVTIARDELLPLGASNSFVQWAEVRSTEVTPLMEVVDVHLTDLDAVETEDGKKNADAADAGYRSGRLTSVLV